LITISSTFFCRKVLKKFIIAILLSILLSIAGFPQAATNVGTEFWIAFPPNTSMSATLKIFISSDFSTSGNVTSAFPGVNQSFTVIPGVVTQLTVPSGVALQTGVQDKGIHITAADPIAVYGLNRQSATTDAYMALPLTSLGTDYRIMTYQTTVGNNGSALSVVATQNGTTVSIYNFQTAGTTNITLDQGQTYYLDDGTTGDDLTGSRVQSNFPVSVYGSVKLTYVPSTCQFGDHIVEQMWPISSWGKNFATVFLAGRDASGDIFRVLASEDGTDVSINGTVVTTLNMGQHYETNLTGFNSITTNKAACVAQFAKGTMCTGNITGDPFMMLIPPREQFLTNYTICTVSGFTSHWVNVVAPDYALGTILQDGVLIPNSAFTQIGSTNYWGAQRSITDGSHTLSSTFPFGVFVYGWTTVDSYGYPGGGSLSPVGTVNSVTLTPPTASGQLNITSVCFTAHVLDSYSNPVVGVLVNFNIYGINPLVGNAYTDALGDALYCYTQTGTIPGTDSVYAEVFGFRSDTSVVFWSYTPPCINPATGGTIGSDQSGCGSFTPAAITSLSLPSGQSGTLEYKWQQSTSGPASGYIDIPGSNAATWNPGMITQTTWLRRLARVDCMPDWTGAVSSNVVQMLVNPVVTPDVSITPSANNVCQGTLVTFTATPVYGGTTPSFQWKVNGVITGFNNVLFSYSPGNGDAVTCTLTSSELCPSVNPVTSSPVNMIVDPILPVGISVSASANPVCSGSTVTFTALPVHPGLAPFYQWKMNGINVGSNSTVYTYIPLNGDQVSCILTSSEICTSNNPATSNQVNMVVTNYSAVGISVSASANPVCASTVVTYTANPTNGGTSPVYQWKINGINAGSGLPTYNYSPVNGDLVSCILTSNLSCTTNNPVTSNVIAMNVNALPAVSFTRCNDSITITTAKPFRLKGGIPLGGTYSGPGVSNGTFNPSVAGIGTKTITYSYTNYASCSATANVQFIIRNPSFTTCGSDLTDPRDNKTYPTVQVVSQCWMASNLNYGTMINGSTSQRDNCIPEKYCFNNIIANCGLLTANYQWDEIMNYDETISNQGLCPPGWHIPGENDWTILFSNFINNGFAASPLKYSGFSGFDALLSGSGFLNKIWYFRGFSTFFWSSTAHGSLKAWAHGMNDPDASVSAYPAFRSNAFSVRCLKDQ
jgi:uncharacterized protein (TIGR02145 family)